MGQATYTDSLFDEQQAIMSYTLYGAEGGAIHITITPSQGGNERRAMVFVNSATATKIDALTLNCLPDVDYDESPDCFKRNAQQVIIEAVPELIKAICLAKTHNVMMIEVTGLRTTGKLPATPLDGVVAIQDVRPQVVNLVGTIPGAWGLVGFAYASENKGRLLRAVAPVAKHATNASSQGFIEDLGWHQDNANRAVPNVPDTRPGNGGPMNPYQAFLAIRPDPAIPMEIAALSDIVSIIVRQYGTSVIDQLELPNYAVDKPETHGGGRDVEGVPLLIRDANGLFHGRFDAGNVVGLTAQAQRAFDIFLQVASQNDAVMEVHAQPGSLLMYSNIRGMHRRRRYVAKLDGSDRYFIRLYLMDRKTLATCSAHANGRVFS